MAVALENLPSLDELISRQGLERKDLERKCPVGVRLDVAKHLGDWKMVGRYLGFPPQTLNDIEVENRTEERRRVALLDTWDKREGKGATYLKLAEALHRRMRTDLVEKLCEIIKSSGIEDVQHKDHSDNSVQQRIQSLEDRILQLSRQLRHELEEKITADDLLDELSCLPIKLRREYQDSAKKIATFGDTCRSVGQLFHLIINQLTTFLDYKLLEHLISKFGSSQLKQKMVDYVHAVNNFKRETTVAELMDHWNGIDDQSVNLTDLQIRFGEDPMECTLEGLDKHRTRFCSRYRLSEFVMILICLKPGSFIVVWRIPTVLVSDITDSNPPKNDLFFDKEKILSISMAGKQLFSTSSDQPSGPLIKDLPHLRTTDEEQASGALWQTAVTAEVARRAINELVTIIEQNFRGFNISEIVKGGSMGHGTTVPGHFDIDLVIYSRSINGNGILQYPTRFMPWLLQLNMFLDKTLGHINYNFTKMTEYAVQFNYKGQVDVDLLVSPYWDTPHSLYKFLQTVTHEDDRKMFTVCASKWQVEFFKEQPNEVKEYIRRAKAWRNRMWPKDRRAEGKPTSYLMSLLVLRAYENWVNGYYETITKSLIGLVTGSMDVCWEMFYNCRDYPDLLPSRPRLVDPANPANNVWTSGFKKCNPQERISDYEPGNAGDSSVLKRLIHSIDLSQPVY